MSEREEARVRWRKARNLADRIAGLPPTERERVLREHCDEDGETRRLIESWEAAAEAEDGADFLADQRPGPLLNEQDVEGGPTIDREWIRGVLRELEDEGLLDSASGPLPADKILGEYRLLRRIGRGGMGSVWVAEQRSLGQMVAVKVLHQGALASPRAVERFQQEARALARLDHPHIVKVLACEEAEGVHFLAMHLVRGKSLSDLLRDRRLFGQEIDLRRPLEWARDIARALAAAHEEGILHRDVKPSNLRITPEAGAVLVDFGIARDLDATSLTRTRDWVGSPRYASPEQVRGDRAHVGKQTDLYSLGVTLYECLAGHPPFEGDTAEGVFEQILHREPEPLQRRNPAVPRNVATVVHRCLEKRPRDRYSSAADLAADLQRLLDEQPPLARPPAAWVRLGRWTRRHRGWAAATAALLLVAALAPALRWAVGGLPGRTDEVLAAALLTEAEEMVEAYRDSREKWADRDAEAVVFEEGVLSGYMAPTPLVTGYEKLEKSRFERRRRDELYYGALRLVQRAAELDAGSAADQIEGELYVQRLSEHTSALLTPPPGFAMGEKVRVRRRLDFVDPGGEYRERIQGEHWAGPFHTKPAGAEVYCFEYRLVWEENRQGDERVTSATDLSRWTPCPVGPAELGRPQPDSLSSSLIASNAWCLRVTRPRAPFEADDLIVQLAETRMGSTVFARDPANNVYVLSSVDGRGMYEWLDNKTSYEFPMRSDIDRLTRTWSRPQIVFDLVSHAGLSHRHQGPSLEEGWRLLSARELAAEGGTEARVLRGGQELHLELSEPLEVRVTAAPLEYHADWRVGVTSETDPLELTVSEERRGYRMLWLVRKTGYESLRVVGYPPAQPIRLLPEGSTPRGFVRLPYDNRVAWMMEREVTAGEYLEFLNDIETLERERVEGRTRAPRGLGEYYPDWPCDESGRYFLPDAWDHRMPVVGIDADDALAYADWRTREARDRGEGLRFDLPTCEDWRCGTPQDWFGEGTPFRPHWVKCCHARPEACLEPVMSYPVDERPTGAYDMLGSVHEWLKDDYEGSSGTLRAVGGGAWDKGRPQYFTTCFLEGHLPTETSESIGFRLVAHPTED